MTMPHHTALPLWWHSSNPGSWAEERLSWRGPCRLRMRHRSPTGQHTTWEHHCASQLSSWLSPSSGRQSHPCRVPRPWEAEGPSG